MNESWWMAPGLPFLPGVPWWMVFLVMFAVGAGIGVVMRRMRSDRNLPAN